mgnify:CR=1 FL=1
MVRTRFSLLIIAIVLAIPATGLTTQIPTPAPAVAVPEAASPSKAATVTDGIDAPKTDAEAAALVKLLIDAAKSKNWPLFAGLFVMLFLYVAERFGKLRQRVGSKLWPWFGAGIGIAASIAAGLVANIPWQEACLQGFIAGAAATGLWEMLGKHILKPKVEAARPV